MKSTPSWLERFQGVDERLRRARKPSIAPHQYHIDLTRASRFEQGLVLRTVVSSPTGIVDVLADEDEPSTRGICPQGDQLRLRILPLGNGRDSSLDRGTFLRSHHHPIQEEILRDGLFISQKRVDFQGFYRSLAATLFGPVTRKL